MGYKEIVSLDADVVISIGGVDKKTGKRNPTQAEGFYLGAKPTQSKKSKSGVSLIHIFQTPKGNLGVWGKTDMDRKLATAEKGAMTLVKFDKMQDTPNGPMYKYSVAQDADNTIDVSAISEATEQDTDDSTDEEATEEVDTYDAESVADEDALQAAALAAAERKAKVQSLLNGKGKTAKN